MAMLNSQRLYTTCMSRLKWPIFGACLGARAVVGRASGCHGADAGTLQWQVTCKLSAYTINHPKKSKLEFLKMGENPF